LWRAGGKEVGERLLFSHQKTRRHKKQMDCGKTQTWIRVPSTTGSTGSETGLPQQAHSLSQFEEGFVKADKAINSAQGIFAMGLDAQQQH